MAIPSFLSIQNDGVMLSLKVQPRASRGAVGEPLGNELRIKVVAPPVDDAANEAVLELLAEMLDCARNRLTLARGRTSRHKQVRITGLDAEMIAARLAASAGRAPSRRLPSAAACHATSARPQKPSCSP